jgi:cytosine/adenosine deaminase-related metal-dependent hydrolase
MRGPEETPSRIDALKFYTLGSAWFSFDEGKRGSLDVGKLADLAVLSADYLTVPVEKIGGLESELPLAGGQVVNAAGPCAGLDTKPSAPTHGSSTHQQSRNRDRRQQGHR